MYEFEIKKGNIYIMLDTKDRDNFNKLLTKWKME
jgi:hypothetical protein